MLCNKMGCDRMTDDFSLNDMIDFFSASGSGVKVVVMDDAVIVEKTYSCHRCHKEMKAKDLTPFLEWHICDKCMEEDSTL